MENIAHAFAGLLLARTALMVRERRAEASPRLFATASWVGVLASNVPDGDLVLTPFTGGKLGYLLHHRGHTHTLGLAVLLGLVVAILALWLAARRGGAWQAGERRLILGLGVAAPMVHIGMDYWNVYGVHPFWPLSNRWHYGDSVFIVEPLLWLLAAPFLWRESPKRWSRVVLYVIFALGIGLPLLATSFVPAPLRVLLLLVGALSVAVARWAPRRVSLALAFGAFLLVPIGFGLSGQRARAEMTSQHQAAFASEQLLDIAASSWPSNPLCWSAVVVSRTSNELVLRRVRVALWPKLLSLKVCPGELRPGTVKLVDVQITASDRHEVLGETRLELAKLRALMQERCELRHAMRFFRAPFVIEHEGATVIGDLRFDNAERLDFSEIALATEEQCPGWIPPWQPPRADLLD